MLSSTENNAACVSASPDVAIEAGLGSNDGATLQPRSLLEVWLLTTGDASESDAHTHLEWSTPRPACSQHGRSKMLIVLEVNVGLER